MSLPESPNIVPLKGDIDLHNSRQIALLLENLISAKSPRIVVDLSSVSYIDSSGLAVLIDAMHRIEEYGGRLLLAGVNEDIQPIFEVARLDRVFLTFPHVDAALAAE